MEDSEDNLQIQTAERRSFSQPLRTLNPNLSSPWGAKIPCKFILKMQVRVCAGRQRLRSEYRKSALLWQIQEQCTIWRLFIHMKTLLDLGTYSQQLLTFSVGDKRWGGVLYTWIHLQYALPCIFPIQVSRCQKHSCHTLKVIEMSSRYLLYVFSTN